jgi:hypothetical protein
MFEDRAISLMLLKISACILVIFSGLLIFEKQLYFSGISIMGLGAYFGLLAWQKLHKNNVYYFAILTVFSFSLAYENGVSTPLIATLGIVLTGMYYLHYCLIDD